MAIHSGADNGHRTSGVSSTEILPGVGSELGGNFEVGGSTGRIPLHPNTDTSNMVHALRLSLSA